MKYKIQNTSTTTTIWVENSVSGNAFPLGPGEKCAVPETTKNMVLKANPGITTDLGPVTDNDAPAYYSAAPGASWTLITLGPGTTFYSKLRMWSTTTAVQVSFSGWNAAAPDNQTAPPTWSQVTVPVVATQADGLEFDFTMNPTNVLYAMGTGTLTIVAS